MAKKHTREEEDAEIDMTPMLDIVFIMLIFFIVTTSFVKEKGLEVQRPKENQQQNNKPSKAVSILITNEGQIYFNNQLVDVVRVNARIQNYLAENNTDVAVVKAGPKAPHGIVVAVLDQAAEAGLSTLSIAVDKS
ncbi:MAG: biopolymer transporter ExbD [Alteromonadaceae bacterium]|nr:biopolymer transporter ExbD [Alteromonadaceae bacterium]